MGVALTNKLLRCTMPARGDGNLCTRHMNEIVKKNRILQCFDGQQPRISSEGPEENLQNIGAIDTHRTRRSANKDWTEEYEGEDGSFLGALEFHAARDTYVVCKRSPRGSKYVKEFPSAAYADQALEFAESYLNDDKDF